MVINTILTDDRCSGCDLSYWEVWRENSKEYSVMTCSLFANRYNGAMSVEYQIICLQRSTKNPWRLHIGIFRAFPLTMRESF